MSRPTDADDVATYAADDALIDTLSDGTSWGQPGAPDGDPVVELLAAWRAELDDSVLAAGEAAVTAELPGTPWHVRVRRHTAAAAAVVVTLAASTGVAAAASGQHGPFGGLHRVLFGAPPAPAHFDGVADQVISLLDSASARIATAGRAGGVTAAQHAAIGEQLDAAAGLLARDAAAPPTLAAQLAALRAELDQLEILPTPSSDLRAVHLPTLVRGGHGGDTAPTATSEDGATGEQSGGERDGSSSDSTEGSSSGAADAGSGDSGGSNPSDGGSDGSATGDSGSSGSGSSAGDDGGSSGSGSDDGSTSGGDSGSSDSGSSDSGDGGAATPGDG
jgi:hypothetical protein